MGVKKAISNWVSDKFTRSERRSKRSAKKHDESAAKKRRSTGIVIEEPEEPPVVQRRQSTSYNPRPGATSAHLRTLSEDEGNFSDGSGPILLPYRALEDVVMDDNEVAGGAHLPYRSPEAAGGFAPFAAGGVSSFAAAGASAFAGGGSSSYYSGGASSSDAGGSSSHVGAPSFEAGGSSFQIIDHSTGGYQQSTGGYQQSTGGYQHMESEGEHRGYPSWDAYAYPSRRDENFGEEAQQQSTAWAGGEWGASQWAQNLEEEEEDLMEMKKLNRPFIPNLTRAAEGGPDDPTFFRSWPTHVSHDIYLGKERKSLAFQYRSEAIRRWTITDGTPFADFADAAGLRHLPGMMYENINEGLISAFIERWNPETNSFHMPLGEMSIGLQDVYFLLRIEIEGKSVGRSLSEYIAGKTSVKTKTINEASAALGIKADKGGCSHTQLKQYATEPDRMDYATKGAAYMLFLVGTLLFPDKSQNLIPYKYWDYVKDLDTIGEWSWGSALLAMVYRDLGQCTRTDCKKISTCYTLIQAWIYAYFPKFQPGEERGDWDESMPYASKWSPTKEKGTKRNYRRELDALLVSDVEWAPYGFDMDYKSPELAPALYSGVLSCGDVNEPYMPDHFMRQFGRVQRIPSVFIPAVKAWRLPNPQSYVVEYNLGLYAWNAAEVYRWSIEQFGPETAEGHECECDYLAWYMPRTHPFIERPSVDEYRKMVNRVMSYIGPYQKPTPDMMSNLLDDVQSAIEEMRPFYNQGYY